MMDDLPDLTRIVVNPGDVFVLRMKRRISLEQRDAINAWWRGVFPNQKLIILDNGDQVNVIELTT